MRKTIILFLIFSFCFPSYALFGKKKEKPTLVLTSSNIEDYHQSNDKVTPMFNFKTGKKIYFLINNPEGFKSNYIKMQIIKQDDKTNIGGYTRIKNQTFRTNDRYHYSNYFTLSEAGKYFIQIFDIENLSQWLALEFFKVENE